MLSTAAVCGANGMQSLPAGDYNSDLHIVGPCVANGKNGGGVYKYHWVFIHNNGTLTFNDAVLHLQQSRQPPFSLSSNASPFFSSLSELELAFLTSRLAAQVRR